MGHGHERREVARHVADGLLGHHVLDRIDRAVGDELDSQKAPVAGVAVFIREEDGGVEGRQLIDFDIGGVPGEIVGQDGLEEAEEGVNWVRIRVPAMVLGPRAKPLGLI